MRYYDITITDPKSGKRVGYWSTFVNGKTDPAAADVEMDIPVTAEDTPMAGVSLRIWGVSRDIIAETKNWNPANGDFTAAKQIVILGGMQKGLPLAMPKQAGLLCKGTIKQAFGNWIGKDMTLDLVISAGQQQAQVTTPGGQTEPLYFIGGWNRGVQMSEMLEIAFIDAFRDSKPQITISDKLIFSSTQTYSYSTLKEFASFIRGISKSIINNPYYPGVSIYIQNGTIIATDFSAVDAKKERPKPFEILYTDLVGQVTYLGVATASITVIMRGDLKVGQLISLPQGQATVGPWYAYRGAVTFTGNWSITGLRHVGRLRTPSGLAWVTVITAIAEVAGD